MNQPSKRDQDPEGREILRIYSFKGWKHGIFYGILKDHPMRILWNLDEFYGISKVESIAHIPVSFLPFLFGIPMDS